MRYNVPQLGDVAVALVQQLQAVPRGVHLGGGGGWVEVGGGEGGDCIVCHHRRELRNQAIHDRALTATAGISTVITTMDTYTLWWVSQWVEWRKTRIAENGDPMNAAHFRSYKDWVRTTGARVEAGMIGGVSVPQTPQ